MPSTRIHPTFCCEIRFLIAIAKKDHDAAMHLIQSGKVVTEENIGFYTNLVRRQGMVGLANHLFQVERGFRTQRECGWGQMDF